MLSKKMEAAINHQINLEIHSALQYLQMSAYFSSANLNGFAHWMRVQYQEELVHANKLFDYVIARDGDVTLETVAAPPKAWKSTLAALQAGYQAEVNNTKQINALMDSAIKENDHATRVILEWFIEEQVEEENSALNLIEQVKLADGAPGAILLLDRELGVRQPDPAGK
jgi:ferritin